MKWGKGITYDPQDLVVRPLWWQEVGLSETASGYGSRLTTTRVLRIGKRVYRVYCYLYSNAGTCYVIVKGERRPLQNWLDRDGMMTA
jgi:hypothetical protein